MNDIIGYIRTVFVEGRIATAKGLVMDCAVVAQHKNCIVLLDRANYSEGGEGGREGGRERGRGREREGERGGRGGGRVDCVVFCSSESVCDEGDERSI